MKMIPKNFFLYWSGHDFCYAHYVSILSLLKTNQIERCEIYYEHEPAHNADWERLKSLDKVWMIHLDFDDLIKKAGFKRCYFDAFFKQKGGPNHPSNLFRYLILQCYGGIYIDFDILVVRDLGPLLDAEFFIAYQHYNGRHPLNGAVMGSNRESDCLKLCLEEIIKYTKNHAKFSWLAFGPELLNNLFMSKTSTAKGSLRILNSLFKAGWDTGRISQFCSSWIKKKGLDYEIYPKSYFYFYSWPEWEKIFKKNPLPRNTYAIHWWNSKSREFIKTIDEEYINSSDSFFASATKMALGHNPHPSVS